MSGARPFEAWAARGGPPPSAVAELGETGPRIAYAADHAWVSTVVARVTAAGTALRAMRTGDIVGALGTVGRRFLDPRDPLRRDALALLPATSGLSNEMCRAVLDGMAHDWTAERLSELVAREFGATMSDGLEGDARCGSSRLLPPRLCVQVVSGSVPGVSATALIRALLVRAPTLVKPGLGDVVLPVLFARALADVDVRLADAGAVVYWPGGAGAPERAALAGADVVVVYGGDETVHDLRARVPVTARFVPYHHRVSFGVVGRGRATASTVATTAGDVARSVAMFDQRGCVSPHVVWVEEGGDVSPEGVAAAIAAAFAALEAELPCGTLEAHEAAAVQQLRAGAELRRAAGHDVRVWHGGRASWTVVWEGDGDETRTVVGRVLRVRPLPDLADLPERLRVWSGHLQTLGIAVSADRVASVARASMEVGVTRVAPFAEVPFPPAWWRQDGRGVLSELVRLGEVEGLGGRDA